MTKSCATGDRAAPE